MTTIVGIFDNARDLDQAIERLADAGFADTVYDEDIVAREAGNVGPIIAPGSGSMHGMGIAEPEDVPSRPDRHAVVRAFKAHLADYRLPDELIQSYATTFYHEGKFVLVRTDRGRSAEVMDILRQCRATQVNRHG
ncbi:MAG: hypothetical protein M3Z21_09615 [Pseudomonadota bacterium]|nr:hypothetical protein [Pseudomonadota bacterium]